jgi:hypothetical protein
MKIVIIGQGKSGTTALFYALKQSLPENYTCLFEPKTYASGGEDHQVLAKVLLNPTTQIEDFLAFDRKIFIVRDPRDTLVSRILYFVFNCDFVTDEGKTRRLIERFAYKQQAPASVTLLELIELFTELTGADFLHNIQSRHRAALAWQRTQPDVFIFPYESLVAQNFGALENYLGFRINFNGEVDPSVQRVARTKGVGDWKNWFTPTDVEYFSEIFREYLIENGYDLNWQTNPNPVIPVEYSTEYVKRLIAEKKSLLAS